jgi:peptidoglycan/xylan/chitin deacetylase (PgdA/CDA1 family)
VAACLGASGLVVAIGGPIAASWIVDRPASQLTLAPTIVTDSTETATRTQSITPIVSRTESVAPARTDDPFTPAATVPAPEPEPEPAPPRDETSLVLYRGRTEDRVVALTFDDGPGGASTRRVLRVLGDHGVHATFFVLGANAEREPKLLAAIAKAGHELGNHASSHTSFRSLFPSQITAELDQTADAVESVTGLRPRFVRPPFGRYPPSSVDLVRERGEDIVLWSVDANDWAGGTAESIAQGVVAAADPGAVILMHDTAPHTADALPLILDGLARRGLRVVPLSELLARPAWAT